MSRALDRDFDPVEIGVRDDPAMTGDGVDLILTDLGRGAFVPRSIKNLDPEQLNIVGELQAIVRSLQELQEELAELVEEARSQQVPWTAIGWSVGTSPQAARQRWGLPDSPD